MTGCETPHPMDHSNGDWWCGATEPPTRAHRLGDGKVRVDILQRDVDCKIPLPRTGDTREQEIIYPLVDDADKSGLTEGTVRKYAEVALQRNPHLASEQ